MWKTKNGIGLKFQINLDDNDDDVGISRAWESIAENMKASATDSEGY